MKHFVFNFHIFRPGIYYKFKNDLDLSLANTVPRVFNKLESAARLSDEKIAEMASDGSDNTLMQAEIRPESSSGMGFWA